MAYDLVCQKTFSLTGKSFIHQETLSSDLAEVLEVSIPIAWAGTLSTRTDNNTGILTMTDSGHLIATSDKIDLYWSGGQRRYMTVGTVATTTVPIDLGSGDNLPIATTAVIAATVRTYTVSIAGDDVLSLLATADFARCQVTLNSSGPTEELAIHLNATEAYDWLSTSTITNPITGDTITSIHISIADTVTARNVRVATQIDA